MITAVIVSASMALAVAFTAAWALHPGVRAWIEQPKHRFQDQLRRYDRTVTTDAPGPRR